MAKLLRLRGRDFQKLREVDLDLSAPITMVLGRNATGKTSTADLVRYLLLGRCQGTDADGRGAGFLVRRGASELWGELTLEDEGQRYVLARAKNTAGEGAAKLHCPDGVVLQGRSVQARLDEILGASRDIVEATLDSSYVLLLDQRKRSDLLMRIGEVRCTLDELDQAAAAIGLSEGGRERLRRGIVGIAGTAPIAMDHLAEAKKRCEAKRRDARRERDDARSALDRLPPVQANESELAARLSAINQRLSDLATKHDGMTRLSGELSARREERNRVVRRIAELRERLNEIPAEPEAPVQEVLPGVSRCELEIEAKKLRDRETAAQEALKPLEAAAQRVRSEFDTVTAQIQAIETGDTTCLHPTYAGRPCPHVQADLGERAKMLPALLEQAVVQEKAAARAEAKATAARATLDKIRAALEEMEQRLSAVQTAAVRTRGEAEGRRTELARQLEEAEAQLAGLPDPAAEAAALATQVSEHASEVKAAEAVRDAALSDLQAVQRVAAAQRRVEETERDFSLWNELVDCLDPKLLPARVAAPRISELAERINGPLAAITGSRYRIEIVAGDGLEIDVYDADGDTPLYLERLSESEKLRIGVAIGAAVALSTGVKILLVDRADLLDEGNREAFLRGIAAMRNSIETSILCSTSQRNTVSSTQLWRVYRVSEGTFAEVTERDAVGAEAR